MQEYFTCLEVSVLHSQAHLHFCRTSVTPGQERKRGKDGKRANDTEPDSDAASTSNKTSRPAVPQRFNSVRLNSAGIQVPYAKKEESLTLLAGSFFGVPLSALEETAEILDAYAAVPPPQGQKTTCAKTICEGVIYRGLHVRGRVAERDAATVLIPSIVNLTWTTWMERKIFENPIVS